MITMSKSGLMSPELQALGKRRRAFAGGRVVSWLVDLTNDRWREREGSEDG
jgi:hypothetical protein